MAPPGTGKTNAVRVLLGEWRAWADFHFITDPESFLNDPGYLITALSGQRARAAQHDSRWRVFVLEDAGEFLAHDARAATGQALPRLLNVCDGVLGQAMRVLLVITTNEPARPFGFASAMQDDAAGQVESASARRRSTTSASSRAIGPGESSENRSASSP